MKWPVLFLDDGGVMNDNALRGHQWRRLLGEFLPPLLGGAPEAWAEANLVVCERLWDEYGRTMRGRVDADFGAYRRGYQLDWLRGMCQEVGAPAPEEGECIGLADQATAYVTRRVRSAFPGAVEAIRTLRDQGYQLHAASGEHSDELAGYLEGMGIRDHFGRLYGPDLVNTLKEGPKYYERILADAGVSPAEALVVDDSPVAVAWAARAGARTALVRPAAGDGFRADLVIRDLTKLPAALPQLG